MSTSPCYFRSSERHWLLLLALPLLALALFRDSLDYLVGQWFAAEEYSHGVLIPLLVALLIWCEKNRIAREPFAGHWPGLLLLLGGLALNLLGELTTLYVLSHYALVFVALGLVLLVLGLPVFKLVLVPLLFLVFAIPLPHFLNRALSSELQLLSSQIGVAVIRWCDISVYLEGNVIDLGSLKLQVVEACSGLRYLFPLLTLAVICAYFFRAEPWKRGLLVLSSVPVTVLMNSLRIGLIGVTVEYWGKDLAAGFLHDFEGWFVFMACGVILVAEMWLLNRISRQPLPWPEAFRIPLPAPLPEGTVYARRRLPPQYWPALALLLLALGLSALVRQRDEIPVPRSPFAEFPLHLEGWTGHPRQLEQEYLDVLKFDDYILADYLPRQPAPATGPNRELPTAAASAPVNFYSAYYASQRKGESVHSPRSCIPGGGWAIRSLEQRRVATGAAALEVNRLLIQKGDERQLVYYWFQQRGRRLTSEYAVKWYLFWDALTRHRSDGALVRLITPAPPAEDVAGADRRLTEFLQAAIGPLARFVPD